jgi:hypothetical protein
MQTFGEVGEEERPSGQVQQRPVHEARAKALRGQRGLAEQRAFEVAEDLFIWFCAVVAVVVHVETPTARFNLQNT